MHGVNLGGWLSQCSHSVEHYKSFISEEDIRKIADMGADHVRLPIDFECIETESGEPLSFGYVSISECIEWCEKYGLNVILTFIKQPVFHLTQSRIRYLTANLSSSVISSCGKCYLIDTAGAGMLHLSFSTK